MTPRPKAKYPKSELIAVRVSVEMSAALREVQARDGVPISEQVRRGLRLWLDSRGVMKTDQKRARRGTR